MLDLCREILSDRPLFIVLTAYSIRASFFAIHEMMRETLGDRGGGSNRANWSSARRAARALSTSLFSRWIAP